jgi:hypothetical protein
MREKLDTLNGVHSNAAGLTRWLEQQAGATVPPGEIAHDHEHRH